MKDLEREQPSGPEMEILASGLVGVAITDEISQLPPEVGEESRVLPGSPLWGLALEHVLPVYARGEKKVLGIYLATPYCRLAGYRYLKEDGLVLVPAYVTSTWKGSGHPVKAQLVSADNYDQAVLDRLEATNRVVDTSLTKTIITD